MNGVERVVRVSIATEGPPLSRPGFGVPLVLGSTTPIGGTWTERTRAYTSLTGVADDFLTSDAEYKAAAKLFAQQPRPARIKIGRRDANVAAIKVITFSGALVTSNSTVGIINGTSLTATVFATDDATTRAAIATKIAAIEGVASAVAAGVGVFTITVTATAGLPLSVASFVVTLGAGQATAAITTSEAGKTVDSELGLLVLDDNDWYALGLTSTLLEDQKQAADWVEASEKFAGFRTDVAGTLATSTTDIGAYIKANSYRRSFVAYHPTATAYMEFAMFGARLPYTPGAETWAFANLVGVEAYILTETEYANAITKNVTLYQTIGGRDVTVFGTVGTGEFIDQIRGEDWLSNEIQFNVWGFVSSVPKVPFTDTGLAGIDNQILAALYTGQRNGLLADDTAVSVTGPAASEYSSAERAGRQARRRDFTARFGGALHDIGIDGVVTT